MFVPGALPLKKAVLVKVLYTKPWQMLPLLAMASQIFASVLGSVLSCVAHQTPCLPAIPTLPMFRQDRHVMMHGIVK